IIKVYSSTLLAATIITIFATTQSDTGIQTNDSKSFSNRYDSSYDFSEIRRQNRNPKELIGQELEFAPPSSNHVVGSKASLFFNLIDPEDNEVTLYFAFNQPLEQMIHIKGYRKKVEESFSKKSFSFVSSFKVKIESEPVLMGYQMSPDYFKTKINLYNKNWIAGEYKYVSTPERYFQMIYLQLKNDQGEKIYIWLYDMPD